MSNAAILASFAWQAAYSLAAPTPNITAAAAATPVADPGWKKEPNGRGTFSIILTSVLSLGLCVWTAIHPNVQPNASTWQKAKHRLLFVVVGMLAPEVMSAVAFYELREARRFHRDWCRLYDIKPGSKQDTLRMKGAFFVTMGGVSIAPAYKIPSNFRNILSTKAYLKLAQTNTMGKKVEVQKVRELAQAAAEAEAEAEIEAAKTEAAVEVAGLDDPDQSELEGELGSRLAAGGREPKARGQAKGEPGEPEMIIRRDFVHYREVQDKGKAEMLGKTLVCVQALWMLVQCLVRKASGLPVTLLEIHVSMHVICAIGMYGFWFNKPQDVGEPVPIGATSDLGQSYLEIVKQNANYRDGLRLRVRGDEHGLNKRAKDYEHVRPSPTTKSVLFLPAGGVADPPDSVGAEHLIVRHDQMLDLGSVRIYNDRLRSSVVLPSEGLRIVMCAAGAYKAGKRPKLPVVDLLGHVSATDASIMMDDITLSNVSPAIFTPLAYGACHAAAWNTHFPSPVECLLWRISSVVIAVIPAYYLLLRSSKNDDHVLFRILSLWLVQAYHVLDKYNAVITIPSVGKFYWSHLFGTILSIFIEYSIYPICLAVLVGRLYLFVESFLSLRSLPYGSFDSTPWEDYFPHF